MTGWTAPEGAEPVPPSPSPETATGPAYGAPPGSMVTTNQSRTRSCGNRPACTTLDLPVPEAPTSSTSRASPDSRSTTSSTNPDLPK